MNQAPDKDARAIPEAAAAKTATTAADSTIQVALLTAGRDKPYALGLGPALADQGIMVDFLGSDAVDGPEVRNNVRIRFHNFRDQTQAAKLGAKVTRIICYYSRLLAYTVRSRAPIFHILWNNKFETFDRTFLMLFYRLFGKRLVHTVHNVNVGQRDGTDSWFNRLTLRCQYRLCHHLFVHTSQMKAALQREFSIGEDRITVIPFGINNTIPVSSLSRHDARTQLNLAPQDRVLLFFGNIAPYKGLDGLVEALTRIHRSDPSLRLVIAGRTKGSEAYWKSTRAMIADRGLQSIVRDHIRFIPDPEVEVFFKAADVVVLPYTHVFQSGVLFLGYSFGLPVIATDVGSLRDEIVEGQTGLVCRPKDPVALAETIERFFASDLHRQASAHGPAIRAFANEKYSWSSVGRTTRSIYERLLNHGR